MVQKDTETKGYLCTLHKNLVCLQVLYFSPERGRLKGEMNTICETTKETDGVNTALFNLNP